MNVLIKILENIDSARSPKKALPALLRIEALALDQLQSACTWHANRLTEDGEMVGPLRKLKEENKALRDALKRCGSGPSSSEQTDDLNRRLAEALGELEGAERRNRELSANYEVLLSAAQAKVKTLEEELSTVRRNGGGIPQELDLRIRRCPHIPSGLSLCDGITALLNLVETASRITKSHNQLQADNVELCDDNDQLKERLVNAHRDQSQAVAERDQLAAIVNELTEKVASQQQSISDSAVALDAANAQYREAASQRDGLNVQLQMQGATAAEIVCLRKQRDALYQAILSVRDQLSDMDQALYKVQDSV